MGTPKLPLELIDHCLSYLRREHREDEASADDTAVRDIDSCTLVCRAFRPLAQAHLFHQISYSFHTTYNDEGNSDSGGSVTTAGDFPSLYELSRTLESLRAFLTHYPRLAFCIRAVTLNSVPLQFEWRNGLVLEHRVDQAMLYSLLRLLPRLRKLFLNNFVLKDVWQSVDKPPSIPILVLHYGKSYAHIAIKDIKNLISTFAHIGTLTLSNTERQCFEHFEVLTSPITHRIEIEHLLLPELEHSAPAVFANMLACTVHVDNVRRLTLPSLRDSFAGVYFTTSYQVIIDTLSPGLEGLHFEMDMPPFDLNRMTPTHPLDIRSCTKLRKLHLRLSISGNSVRDIASWRWHARSINDFINQSNISASTYRDLRELVISLWVDGTENEQRNPQTLIDELLASLVRRSTLEHITFEWYEKSNLSKVLTGEDFAGFVYASFPTLRENDMISIRAPAEDRH